MILSTQTEVAGKRFGDEKTVKWICEAGFDALDYSMFLMKDVDDYVLNTPAYEKYVLELKKIAESYGKFFNQAHAPFPSLIVDNEEYNKKIFPRIVRSIEIAGILGIKNIVIHPVMLEGVSKQEKLEKNLELYDSFLPYAKQYNVKIATENMFGRDRRRNCIIPNVCSIGDEFREMMDMLDPEWFTACVDIGHAGLVGSNAPDMIRTLGHDYVGCLHVHDNDYVNDRHYPPFMFDLEWDEITKALADIDYKGEFTFESDNFLRRLPESVMPSAFKFLHDIGRSLIEMIENQK